MNNAMAAERRRIYDQWIAEIEANEARERRRSLVAGIVALIAVCMMAWVVR